MPWNLSMFSRSAPTAPCSNSPQKANAKTSVKAGIQARIKSKRT